MVVHSHSMTDHGIAEGSDGERHQTIPGGEEHHGGGVDPADEGWVQVVPMPYPRIPSIPKCFPYLQKKAELKELHGDCKRESCMQ